ncbi:Permease of the drug/metabolite transporter (DMT) superfamily [Halomonas citrativorans]|uniref:Permease of the drug/metabolite transporter (DMT) superfamily n=1 Tax=Halomonas citrativorans TaxID=2742612 RepID=A0A1R4HSP7_9GAMM|nr:DMT family transporter [Halomonas citrativorans]SJN10557.1 Permease of the drug/metabolite transporter (DMT) superfamily [Halomonas citrativorans]
MQPSKARSGALPKQKRLAAFIYLVAGGALLGLSTNVAKLAGDVQLSPLAFLFWSITGAALILLVVAALRSNLPPVTGRTLEYYLVSALVGVAGSNLIFFSAIPHIGAGFVALVITLPPLLTYVGALIVRLERFQMMRAMGVMSALAGAITLAAHKLSAPDADYAWIFLALAGPVLLAIGNLYRTLRWPAGVSGDALAPGMLIAAAALLFSVGLLPGFSLGIPSGQRLPLLLIALQSMVFAGQFLLLFLLQKTGGPVLLSLLGSVGAVVGVPVAIVIQGEAAPEGLLPGALLIGAGIALLNVGKAKQIS